MRELDFTQKASVGQYLPGNSPLHLLIPQVKLLGVLLIMSGELVTSPIFGSLWGIVILLILGRISRTPIKFLFRNVKPVLPFLLIIGLMRLFFTMAPGSPEIVQWGRYTITLSGVLSSMGIFFRFFSLLGLLTLFTAVTPSREIGHGSERLTAPLAKIGFPSHAFSMILTITFRFIPILTMEAENLMKAQASRGAPIGMGRGPIKRIASYIPILVPLFVASLDRSEQLAQAMESRCYEMGGKRTLYRRYCFKRRDSLGVILSLVSLALLIIFRIMQWEVVIYHIVKNF